MGNVFVEIKNPEFQKPNVKLDDVKIRTADFYQNHQIDVLLDAKVSFCFHIERNCHFVQNQFFVLETFVDCFLKHIIFNIRFSLTFFQVLSVDAKGKSLTLKTKKGTQTMKFSKLLLATGGRPKKLPVSGADLNHVHYLRCESLLFISNRCIYDSSVYFKLCLVNKAYLSTCK